MNHPSSIVKLALVAFVIAWNVAPAATHRSLNDKGAAYYLRGQYDDALKALQEADRARPETPEIQYNIANSHFKKGEYDKSLAGYEKALLSEDATLAQKARYNRGNVYYRQNDYQKAIAEYQQAVELDPNDRDAKYNLELARRMLKENSKPQSQDQKKQDKPQEQDKQDQKQEQDQGKEQEKQPQPEQDSTKHNEQAQSKPKPNEMSKEDAERILNAVKDAESRDRQKKKKGKAVRAFGGRQW